MAGVIGAIAGLAVAGGPLAGGVLVQGLDWHWHPLDQRPGRAGAKAGLQPLHDALLGEIRALGAFDIAPKKGYLSLCRRKQFAMVQPSTTSRIDLRLILPAATPAAGRLRGWLAAAYALAGLPPGGTAALCPGRQGTSAQAAQFLRTWKGTGFTRCST